METAMRTRRTTNPNQLALWGRYELDELAMISRSRPAELKQEPPTLPEPKLIVSEPVRLIPSFRPAVDLTPSFLTPTQTHNSPSAHAWTQVSRPRNQKISFWYAANEVMTPSLLRSQCRGHQPLPCLSTVRRVHRGAGPTSSSWLAVGVGPVPRGALLSAGRHGEGWWSRH
ncbi:hypothetical protein LFM09_19845 [Lentzea alba]|uniref:hypothetical protein n=1 Tax=Lentzea alba TaxID=2714351 RepID=UPI0039BF769F